MNVTKVSLLVSIAVIVVGASMFLLVPLYIGALSDNYGYPASALGLLASADLIGVGIASFFASLWINKVNWRTTTIVVWLLFLLGNWLSLSVVDYNTLFILRLVIGICAGVAISIAASILSFASNPGRWYAVCVFLQVSYQTISFVVLPDIISEYQVTGFLLFIITLQLLVLPLLYFIPAHLSNDGHVEEVAQETSQSRRDCYMILVSMALFFICQSGVFAFIDLIGNSNGLDDQSIGLALSLSTFIGLGGAVLAVIIGDRFGRFKPVLWAGCIQIVVLALFDMTTGLVAYTLMLGIFQLCWTFSLGYQFAILVAEDKKHRFAAMVPSAQFSGLALGPIIAGSALEIGGNQGIYLVSSIAIVLFMVVILPRIRTTNNILEQ